MLPYRVGYGEDAHRLQAGLRLMLGGLEIADAPRGAVAHSDGDAALHTVADALLSGLALGDIGQYFPDTDAAWKNLDSADHPAPLPGPGTRARLPARQSGAGDHPRSAQAGQRAVPRSPDASPP